MADTPKGATALEIISPEGVEERLQRELAFRITLTGGGKLRVYSRVQSVDEAGKLTDTKWDSTGVCDTHNEAEKRLAVELVLLGLAKVQPDMFAQIMADALKKKPGGA